MNFTPIIKEVGRGARGARGLEADAAQEVFAALLAGEVTDIQLGAWWLAMRIKGETPVELAAFVAAMQAMLPWRVATAATDGPVAVLPCYNGARLLPNLTPLLAWALARRGVRVVLHGVRNDPTRVTTCELFTALGFPVVQDASEAERALTSTGMAFAPLDAIHPPLAALLNRRWQIGVRSTPHTVAKLLNPVNGAALRVVALTHGDYIERMSTYFAAQADASAIVFRGCEGEPVLHPKRAVPLHIFRNGVSVMRDWPGVLSHDLPDTHDIATTVAYIESVVRGARVMPPWIDALAQEVHSLTYEINAIHHPAHAAS